ncbi:calcium-binding protein [soil metagenome]
MEVTNRSDRFNFETHAIREALDTATPSGVGRSATKFRLDTDTGYILVRGTGFTYNTDGFPVTGAVSKIEVHFSDRSSPDAELALEENEQIPGGSFTFFLNGGIGEIVDMFRDKFEHYTGGAGDDRYQVFDENENSTSDVLEGGGGNDTLDAYNGNDTSRGNAGNDVIIVRNGDKLVDPNIVFTGVIDGGSGIDTYQFFDHTTEILGSKIDLNKTGFQDTNHGKQKITNIENVDGSGFSDGDNFIGNGVNNILRGAGGIGGVFDDNDKLDGRGGNDQLFGEEGEDQLLGGDGNDKVDGGTRSDLIKGEDGNDQLKGGDGADNIQGGNGNDRLDGGGNEDFGVAATETLSGGAGNDTAKGGLGDDVIKGDSGGDELHGDDGNDKIYGGLGNDVIYGGSGNDIVSGGAGDDTVSAGVNGGVNAKGDIGDDILSGSKKNDTLDGGVGNDYLIGGKANDVLSGQDDNDKLQGDGGNDTLNGGDGRDTLEGGADKDSLNGGNGNDTLTGGGGNDTLIGGLGEDEFRFSSKHGTDRVNGFNSDEDDLHFTGIPGVDDFTDLEVTGNGTATVVVTTPGGGTIILQASQGSTIILNADNVSFLPLE